MVYKFRSLGDPNLVITTKDSDGDLVSVSFSKIQYPGREAFGIFETEDVKLAEGLKADKRNGVLFRFADPSVKKQEEKKEDFQDSFPGIAEVVSEPKTQKTSKRRSRKK